MSQILGVCFSSFYQYDVSQTNEKVKHLINIHTYVGAHIGRNTPNH